MSNGNLGQVVKRAISDAAFRRQLQSDPEGALKGFDLSSDERAALRSGDASKLSSLGIDQRMSKAFAMGEGAAAVSKWGTGNDLAMGATIPDGGEPLVSDALISGGGGRASDALIGEASGAKGARISDAGGSVRTAVTDGERLAQVNAAFQGGDAAAGRNALGDQHDGGRAAIGDSPAGAMSAANADGLAQVNAAFEGSDSAAGGRALGDQHDGGRAAIGDSPAGAISAADSDRLGQVNAAFEGSDSAAGGRALGDQHDVARGTVSDSTASVGRNALGDQHDGGRAAIGGTDAASREGSAYITADEAGRDSSAATLGSSDSAATSAFMTADEMGNDATAAVRAPDADTAITQREALDDAAMANPEGHAQPDPTA